MCISDFISQLYNRFPEAKYLGIMEFNKPIIILRDPDLIKDVCIKNFDNFPDHSAIIREEGDSLFGRNVFVLRGDRWKEMRSTLSPSFTGSKMKIMFQLVSKCSENFIQYFLDNPNEANSVEMKDAFTRYTSDVIASAAFGIGVNSIQERSNEFYLRGRDATEFTSPFRLLKIFIFIMLPKFMNFIGEPILSRSTDRFFKKLIRETVQMRHKNNIVRPDMIQLLMEASQVSIDDIIAQAFIFFFAGFAPSSALMGFIAHELAVNPEIQEKLYNEIDYFIKQENGEISYETLSKMKYLDMVICETLRKYPPTAIADRLCVKKYTLPKSTPESKDYVIEPNNLLWLPIYALHHDEKYFPNPEKFDPERFNDENKDKINPYTYIPFGLGPRKCIGNRFVLMEAKILFVNLIRNFILIKSEKTKHPLEFEKGFNFIVKGEFLIKFQKRMSK